MSDRTQDTGVADLVRIILTGLRNNERLTFGEIEGPSLREACSKCKKRRAISGISEGSSAFSRQMLAETEGQAENHTILARMRSEIERQLLDKQSGDESRPNREK